jgi:hypothetical protein
MEVKLPLGNAGLEPPYLVRLSVLETIAIQALRQLPAEKQEAVVYLLQTMAIDAIRERPNNVVCLRRIRPI